MMYKGDVNKEYEKELIRYRSQQVIMKALLAAKDYMGKTEPEVVQLINVTYLSNDLNLNRGEVDSLFGTKLSSKSLEPLQRAKLMKHLFQQITTQCNDVNSFARKMKQDVQFNVFEMDNTTKQIELLLANYNEKLLQLVKVKARLCDLESQAVQLKSGSEQRKQLELFRLEVKRKIIENERFKRILLHRMCNQTAKNTEALLKLKYFLDDMS
ncbi:uncharacterized protein LOC119069908 [Bradysia coprophila]|uniref:uncharacterized protein LOC119069908 n=1 Tax=Bradysia coprophila TaxID=38358 RepID=UPI00187DCA16|nr:uncharacterized protein LOC119069908 [Bradysia coprophila]